MLIMLELYELYCQFKAIFFFWKIARAYIQHSLFQIKTDINHSDYKMCTKKNERKNVMFSDIFLLTMKFLSFAPCVRVSVHMLNNVDRRHRLLKNLFCTHNEMENKMFANDIKEYTISHTTHNSVYKNLFVKLMLK